MIVIFLGPPGAGKGTQCKLLVDRYGLKHLSSGDILRRERKEGTNLGKQAQSYMDSGQLVPDDLIVAMMMKEIQTAGNSGGFVLDGFPRTIGQALELDKALEEADKEVDVVLNLRVDDIKLEERIVGRRSCSRCGAAYHMIFNPPQNDNLCDRGCGPLMQRADDTAEVVRNRIKNYHELTSPLISYYSQTDNLHHIDGNVSIDEVTAELLNIMDGILQDT